MNGRGAQLKVNLFSPLNHCLTIIHEAYCKNNFKFDNVEKLESDDTSNKIVSVGKGYVQGGVWILTELETKNFLKSVNGLYVILKELISCYHDYFPYGRGGLNLA
eukprot:Pgem_evm1s10246